MGLCWQREQSKFWTIREEVDGSWSLFLKCFLSFMNPSMIHRGAGWQKLSK